MSKRIISLLMENEPGALSRVVGLFSQRGYNIDSLNVAAIHDPTLSRLTLTTDCEDATIEQITKQLNKLIDVVKVLDITEGKHVEREMMLIKLRARGVQRAELLQCVDIFRGQIVDIGPGFCTAMLTGDGGKLDSFIEALGDITILEVVRSGVCGIPRGEKALAL